MGIEPMTTRFLGGGVQSGIFFCFMAFRVTWEIGSFFDARGSFSRISAKKKFDVFLAVLVFLLFFGGVFVLLVFFCLFSARSAKKILVFFSAVP